MSKSTTPHRDNASVRSGSNLRFSTFGYETPPPPPPVSSSTYRQQSTNPQSSIDTLDSDNGNYQRTQSIGPICHHHHQHQQFLQKQLLDQQQQMNEISWDVKPQHHHTKHHRRDCPAADESNHSSSTNSNTNPNSNTASKSSSKKHSKNDDQQSKVFIDVGRHSAPDVIIMTH